MAGGAVDLRAVDEVLAGPALLGGDRQLALESAGGGLDEGQEALAISRQEKAADHAQELGQAPAVAERLAGGGALGERRRRQQGESEDGGKEGNASHRRAANEHAMRAVAGAGLYLHPSVRAASPINSSVSKLGPKRATAPSSGARSEIQRSRGPLSA